MAKSGGLMVALFVWVLSLWAGSAEAATRTVCSSSCSHTSIQAAYNASANTGDTVDVTDSRTYTEDFDVQKNITIKASAASPATWKGTNNDDIFKVKGGKSVVVEGFIFDPTEDYTIRVEGASTLALKNVSIDGFSKTNKDGVGVKVVGSSTLTVEDSTFTNLKSRNGGAIYAYESSVTITDCVFDGNSSTVEGGSIFVRYGDISISGSSFDNSESGGWGGTVYIEDADIDVSSSTFGTSKTTGASSNGGHIATYSDDWTVDDVTITNTTFTNGTAKDSGGSVMVWWSRVTITGGSFTNNAATGDGGAIHFYEVDDSSISNAVFTNNETQDDGGAINATLGFGTLDIDGNTFSLNQSVDNGGGIRVVAAVDATITENVFTDNVAGDSGGAITLASVTVATIKDNEYTSNSADQGGAVRVDNVGDMLASGGYYCDNNAATGKGGAVFVNDGGGVDSQWSNNIFNENEANTQGGAVYVEDQDPVFLNNHFLSNDAATSGGALAFSNADYTFKNNLVAWTVGGNGLNATWSGSSTYTMDYNNWYANTTNDASGALSSSSLGSNSLFLDPDLEDYTADGNCANDKMWPATTSPLIDAGDPSTVLNDPDGTRSDIGAFGGPNADPDLYTDGDGDGYIGLYDCDDSDGSINPGATEVCDGADVDEDCDGVADDADSSVDTSTQLSWYEDADEDTYGDTSLTVLACDDPTDATTVYVANNTDCNDSDSGINPGATEVCDGADVDEDCDMLSDDADSSVDTSTQFAWYVDADSDSYGSDSAPARLACDDPSAGSLNYVANNSDCDDTTSSISPIATEGTGDEVDQNCDGQELCYVDADDDTYRFGSGTVTSSDEDCSDSGEATSTDPTGDCDDDDNTIYPGADEYCDGEDNDCDGVIDESSAVDAATWYSDGDGDFYGDESSSTQSCTAPTGYIAVGGDCNDGDNTIYPGANEYCDSVDTDCDGTLDEDDALDAKTWYADTDGDFFGDPLSTKNACYISSGYVSDATDCDDLSANTYPGADEYCDGVDTDCDGALDEDDALDATMWYLDADSDDYGVSTTSTKACAQPTGYVDNATDCDDTNTDINPGATEVCDGTDTDEDCDMLSDDADSSVDPSTQLSWYPDADLDLYGDATATGTLACDDPSTMASSYVLGNTDCDDALNAINPGATEVCDGVDNDCDGSIDEDDAAGAPTWYADGDGDGYGLAGDTTVACNQPTGYAAFDGDCRDFDAFSYPTASELCDDVDNDCDGMIDEDIEVVEWYPDADGDNFGSPDTFIEDCAPIDGHVLDSSDCDDLDSEINPDADEIWYDGVDQNCDDWSDYDQDFDTFDSDDHLGTDCDDLDPDINPDADEVWYDGVDQNCDDWSDYDQDQDGFDSSEYDGGEDCDDDDKAINPDAVEVPDNTVDEDCNGESTWTPDDGRQWSSEGDGTLGEGCNCSVATTAPMHHLLWLFLTGLAGLRMRRHPRA